MVKNYWEKKFKKELDEEQSKLEQEVSQAARKKLDENKATCQIYAWINGRIHEQKASVH